MASRELVARAVNHQIPDRVPIDLGSIQAKPSVVFVPLCFQLFNAWLPYPFTIRWTPSTSRSSWRLISTGLAQRNETPRHRGHGATNARRALFQTHQARSCNSQPAFRDLRVAAAATADQRLRQLASDTEEISTPAEKQKGAVWRRRGAAAAGQGVPGNFLVLPARLQHQRLADIVGQQQVRPD